MSDHAHTPGDSQAAPGDLERVRQFINTLDLESGEDELAGPEQASAWLKQNRLLHPDDTPLSRSEWDRIIHAREALRSLLRTHGGERLDPAALELLDREARRGFLLVRFSEDDDFELEPGVEGLDGALARIFATVHTAAIDGSWPLLKICGNDGCRWAFFDHSRNHSGVWCSMASCGNRMKARAYRERKANTS